MPFSLPDLDRLLSTDPVLAALRREVQARMAADPAHDAGHLRRVAVWTVRLCGDREDPRLAVAAALLHDVVNLPKDHPQRAQASELSAQVTREVLAELGFGPEETERAAGAVRDHSYSRAAALGGGGPETLLGEALQDADRLEALGALGTLRTAAVGGSLGRALLDPADPWARERPLDDSLYTLDHFFVKLLRLPETFRTEAGRSEARRRADTMRAFLAALGEELGERL